LQRRCGCVEKFHTRHEQHLPPNHVEGVPLWRKFRDGFSGRGAVLVTVVRVSSEREHWESVWTEKSFDEVSWHQTDASL
jgi:hypothetical protein